jgi:hypothetical protein
MIGMCDECGEMGVSLCPLCHCCSYCCPESDENQPEDEYYSDELDPEEGELR